MNQRAVLAGALCLFAIGLGVYVLTLPNIPRRIR